MTTIKTPAIDMNIYKYFANHVYRRPFAIWNKECVIVYNNSLISICALCIIYERQLIDVKTVNRSKITSLFSNYMKKCCDEHFYCQESFKIQNFAN